MTDVEVRDIAVGRYIWRAAALDLHAFVSVVSRGCGGGFGGFGELGSEGQDGEDEVGDVAVLLLGESHESGWWVDLQYDLAEDNPGKHPRERQTSAPGAHAGAVIPIAEGVRAMAFVPSRPVVVVARRGPCAHALQTQL
jgi:hypothetical protein